MDKENKLFAGSIVSILLSVIVLILAGDRNMKLADIPIYILYPSAFMLGTGLVLTALWIVELIKKRQIKQKTLKRA